MAQGKRRRRAVAIAATLMAVTAGGIGLWSVGWRAITDRVSPAIRAYSGGQWAAAAELARQTLAVRKDDPAALRLLARASARLGRDAAAMAIYQRRLDEKGSRPKIIFSWA